jgi:enoyl-CoA hydratase/carnithine racemase
MRPGQPTEHATVENFARLHIQNGIATVTINRPDRHNALHIAAHRDLAAVFDQLAADQTLRAVILTGAGERAFCAGYDLRENLETGRMEIPSSGFGGLTFRTDFPVPLIAAVNGIAMGGGFEMALACDLILASETASFALPEPKVGWAALGGGLQRLPRAIGTKRAMAMILTGRTVSAQEGLALGFVNEVTAPRDLLARTSAWVAEIAACAPLAVRCSKAVAYASLDQPDLASALDVRNYDLVDPMMRSDDALEGKKAFAERRKPHWTGH